MGFAPRPALPNLKKNKQLASATFVSFVRTVVLFPKMASHDVISGDKLPHSQLPLGSHVVEKS